MAELVAPPSMIESLLSKAILFLQANPKAVLGVGVVRAAGDYRPWGGSHACA
jgi:hypothetical protein